MTARTRLKVYVRLDHFASESWRMERRRVIRALERDPNAARIEGDGRTWGTYKVRKT